MNNTPPTPSQVNDLILARTASFRMQFTRFLDFLGVIILAIGAVDLKGLVPFIPDAYAPWVLAIGAILSRSQAVVLFIGDWIDNGKRDNSFKFGGYSSLILLCCVLALSPSLVACKGFTLVPTPDGCFVATRTRADGSQYGLGPCIDTKGKVDRSRGTWTNAEGVRFEGTYYLESRKYVIMYFDPVTGVPVIWTKDSGVSIGDPPPGYPIPVKTIPLAEVEATK